MNFLKKSFKFIRNILTKNWLFIILIILASFLRLYRLGGFATFLGDQGRDAIIVKRIITFEHFPAIGAPTSIGQVYLGPFYYYLITPFLFLFRLNPLGLAFGVALLSILGLISIYFVSIKDIDKKTAFLFTFFVSFSYANINLSRYSWNPNLLPLFSFFTLYFFYQALKTKKNYFFILWGAFFSFSFQLHYLASFLIIPMILFLVKEKKLFYLLKKHLFALYSFLFFSFPLLFFDLRHNFLNSKNFIKMFSQQNVIAKQSLWKRLFDVNRYLLINTLQVKFSFLSGAFFLIIVLYLLKKTKKNKMITLHLYNLLGFIIMFSFLNSPRYPHYYGMVYYSFFIVLAYIISQSKRNFLKIIYFFLIIIYLLTNIKQYYFLFDKPNNQILKAKKIAQSIIYQKPKKPFQMVALPSGESDTHVRYFLEINNYRPLPDSTTIKAKELYVLCYRFKCDVLGNPEWQIATFTHAKIDKIWASEGIKIYKLVH